jgi:hydroxypyruvate reductase
VELCDILKTSPDHNLCLIAGGETTVTISGQGTGGRNQELALASIPELAGLQDVLLVTLATDGEDGPTDAAGAVVSGSTAQLALDSGLSVTDYLKNNDSYQFFDQIGDLIKIGSTGTNVNDLTFLFRF